ncbi:MAG: hypothetical protein AAGL89_08625 [Pseudomonadota bacterium]
MNTLKVLGFVALGLSVSGCGEVLVSQLEGGQRTGAERWVDAGRDEKSLTQLVAGIWVDPNGCDHWIIDDGIEGYLSERLTPDGRPVCSGVAPPSTVVGPFQGGTSIADPL